MAELKSCPFCGGEADFIGAGASIKCKNCGGAFLVTNPFRSRYEVAKAWNARAVIIDKRSDSIGLEKGSEG